MNGRLVPPGTGENRIAFGSDTGPTWSSTSVRPSTAAVGYGVYFRADGKVKSSRRLLPVRPWRGQQVHRAQGRRRRGVRADCVVPPTGFSVYDGSTRSPSAPCGRHIAKVDGKPVLYFTDGTFTSGGAGLRSWDSSSAVSFTSAKVLGTGSGSAGCGGRVRATSRMPTTSETKTLRPRRLARRQRRLRHPTPAVASARLRGAASAPRLRRSLLLPGRVDGASTFSAAVGGVRLNRAYPRARRRGGHYRRGDDGHHLTDGRGAAGPPPARRGSQGHRRPRFFYVDDDGRPHWLLVETSSSRGSTA